MKVEFGEIRCNFGEIRLLPESIDDLWHLQHLIAPGDLVFATTFRSVDTATDKIRPEKTEKRPVRLGIRVDINTVINKANAGHLSELVRWVAAQAPYVKHFVWNNLDPMMNRASLNPELVPRLRDFEVELHKAMVWLAGTGRTFRVERVPLCFMSEFPHRSTETRKFVKDESRRIYFLDEKGLRVQGKPAWSYDKAERCRACSNLDALLVATDDPRIRDAVLDFGGQVADIIAVEEHLRGVPRVFYETLSVLVAQENRKKTRREMGARE